MINVEVNIPYMGIETIFMLCLKEDCMILNRHAGSRMFEIFLWEELLYPNKQHQTFGIMGIQFLAG